MSTVEVLYVSAVSSQREFQSMKEARRPGIQEVTYGMIESGFKFHSLIQQGLVSDSHLNILSLVGRSVEPRFYKGLYWRRRRERPHPNLVIDHLSFPNVRIVKQLWLATAFVAQTLAWRFRTRKAKERVLIADAAYVSVLPGVLLAMMGSKVKKVAIFGDVYSYMAKVTDANQRRSAIHALFRWLISSVYRRLDGFVILTQQMNSIVNPTDKPRIVMEGLVDAAMEGRENQPEDKDAHATVLYAGALRAEYGLDALIDGFSAYGNPDARLKIYGGGDFDTRIVEASAIDKRITFGGTLTIAEVVREEERAWLLINPRPVDQEFAQLSFPSKNMEYLSTGTPVLTTRLPGMPEEYLDYVFTIDASGPEAITEALERVFAQSATELHERGARSKRFVLSQKNNLSQAKRILEFARAC